MPAGQGADEDGAREPETVVDVVRTPGPVDGVVDGSIGGGVMVTGGEAVTAGVVGGRVRGGRVVVDFGTVGTVTGTTTAGPGAAGSGRTST
jgi:hypothetical protein